MREGYYCRVNWFGSVVSLEVGGVFVRVEPKDVMRRAEGLYARSAWAV